MLVGVALVAAAVGALVVAGVLAVAMAVAGQEWCRRALGL
jgi:hypothetical protein